MKLTAAVLTLALTLAMVSNTYAGGSPAFGEPLVLPSLKTMAADPMAIKVGDTYYLYPTTNEKSIECWSGKDLVNWKYEGEVWGPAQEGAWNDDRVWAPEVFEYEGAFYMYYSSNNKIGLAVSDSPTGPFEDAFDHPLIGGGYGNAGAFSIDAHIFQDEDGALYIYCTGYYPFSCIRVSPMDDPYTVTGEWEVLFCPEVTSWELFINEGSWVIRHEGRYYMMYSGSGANFPNYAIGYAVSDSPMGPFEKFEGNPILRANYIREFYGPGHNSVVYEPDGRMLMFYHTKDYSDFTWDRSVRINELAFSEDGELFVVLDEGDDDDIDDDDDQDYEPEKAGKSDSDNEWESGGCVG